MARPRPDPVHSPSNSDMLSVHLARTSPSVEDFSDSDDGWPAMESHIAESANSILSMLEVVIQMTPIKTKPVSYHLNTQRLNTQMYLGGIT